MEIIMVDTFGDDMADIYGSAISHNKFAEDEGLVRHNKIKI